MSISVVIADDSFLIREGLSRMLSGSAEVRLLAACQDLPEALEAVDSHRPDVVLTDIRMPPGLADEGIRLAEHCRVTHPGMGVLLLSQYIEIGYVRTLLEAGTQGRGYLLKERVARLGDLLDAVREVADGGSAIDPKVVQALVRIRTRAGDRKLAALSPRELQVLAQIAQGHTNAAVADHLVLTRHAVEKHINSIFTKLGLGGDPGTHPRVRATLLYLAEGEA
ncbi:response regulator transcription factor [Nakamurella lactea]|uniref:response regulator transcription factor n=1 Tax=Nakamurella lactea TaxID=459515 RepID=UPI00041B10B0|nr:response regulator transcription factor [Nakamurella lactea]